MAAQGSATTLADFARTCLSHLGRQEVHKFILGAVQRSGASSVDHASVDARNLVHEIVRQWPTTDAAALCRSIHKGMDEQARIALIMSLEPQLGDSECEFLAAACARQTSTASASTQTASDTDASTLS